MRKLRILERLEANGTVFNRVIICELFYENQFQRMIREGWREIE